MMGFQQRSPRETVACPWVIHRWFSSGEGWAYHPDLSANLLEISEQFKNLLQSRSHLPHSCWKYNDDAREWFCYHEEDTHPLDPKAVGRRPTIFWAVGLPGRVRRPGDREMVQEYILNELKRYPLPERPGPKENLVLDVPKDWIALVQTENQAPSVPSRPILTTFKKIGTRRLLIMASITVVIGFLVCWGVTLVGCADAIKPEDVQTKLLEPLGVQMPVRAKRDDVCREFCQLYWQEGMRKHLQARGYLLPPPDGKENLRHPDLQFARHITQENSSKIEEILAILPSGKPSGKSRLFSGALTIAVNQVAKRVPQEELVVADGNAVRILEYAVVEKLRPLLTKPGKYERWCATARLWEAGERFPWDEKPSERIREQVKGFWRAERYPSEVRRAAEEMYNLLSEWGVEGVTEADCRDRPWFVGRCFLEFLSQKHFSPQDRHELTKEGTIQWKEFLQKLPEEGWFSQDQVGKSPQETELWDTVESKLNALAAQLKINPEPLPTGTVQMIGSEMKGWVRQLERMKEQRPGQLRDIEEKIKKIENEIKKIGKEINNLIGKQINNRQETQRILKEVAASYQRQIEEAEATGDKNSPEQSQGSLSETQKKLEENNREFKEKNREFEENNRELEKKKQEREEKKKALAQVQEEKQAFQVKLESSKEVVKWFWDRLKGSKQHEQNKTEATEQN